MALYCHLFVLSLPHPLVWIPRLESKLELNTRVTLFVVAGVIAWDTRPLVAICRIRLVHHVALDLPISPCPPMVSPPRLLLLLRSLPNHRVLHPLPRVVLIPLRPSKVSARRLVFVSCQDPIGMEGRGANPVQAIPDPSCWMVLFLELVLKVGCYLPCVLLTNVVPPALTILTTELSLGAIGLPRGHLAVWILPLVITNLGLPTLTLPFLDVHLPFPLLYPGRGISRVPRRSVPRTYPVKLVVFLQPLRIVRPEEPSRLNLF
ncbi:hypothetical protein Nepgr_006609 [Nepenthes gracilis]|uniref:Uncharacterized protein n=1 Tax=Nepenthes gracilis TaxID=150966 RepID=A0AAD3XHI5_NEPGR|nr:hypothetical protein Nepgr_006609 [Nepenthes gracilis]